MTCIDRARPPLTGVRWRLSLTAEGAWGICVSGDGFAAVLYPFLWTHNFGHTAYSWLNAVQVGAGILLGEWIGGYLSDRSGRRTILAVGTLVYGAFMIGLSQVGGNFVGLMLMSLGQSVGIGFMLATNATYMHEIVPPQVRGRITQAAQARCSTSSRSGCSNGATCPRQYSESRSLPGGSYTPNRLWAISITPGPITAIRSAGNRKKMSGKVIFTGTFCACSSAR